MWNQVTCNKVVLKKSLEKEKARFLESLRNTKSTIRSSNPHRLTFKSNSKKATQGSCYFEIDKNMEISKQNKNMATRIQSICKQRITRSMEKVRASTSLLKMIDNNKRKINQIKNKEIQQANKKILQKIVSVNSSLTNIRLKTIFNETKNKPKTIFTIQNLNTEASLKNSFKRNQTNSNYNPLQSSNIKSTKTQIAEIDILENSIQNNQNNQLKCRTQQRIEDQQVMDQAIQQFCDNN